VIAQIAKAAPWALDRSPLDGFRCVQNRSDVPADATPRPFHRRDFTKATPATNEVFRVYRNMYAYGKRPIRADVERIADAMTD
jgi:hypothetical protein